MSNAPFTPVLNDVFSIVAVKDHDGDTHPVFRRAMERAEALGISRAEFQESIGINKQMLNHWRTRGIPARRHQQVAEVLQWTVEELLGKAPPHQGGTGWPFPEVPAARFHRLSPGQKLQVQGVMLDKIIELETPPQRKSPSRQRSASA